MTDAPATRDSARKRIGIAVVERAGQYLVGIRGQDTHLAGKTEFPGGKCFPNESEAACAVRECLEETGLRVDVVRLLCELDFDYPHAKVQLSFFLCQVVDADAVAPIGWTWVPAMQLVDLDFPEANRSVIQMLADRPRTPDAQT